MEQLNSGTCNKYPMPLHVFVAVRLKMRVKEKDEEIEGERWVWKESRESRYCLLMYNFAL
jgi:hypothetical protein